MVEEFQTISCPTLNREDGDMLIESKVGNGTSVLVLLPKSSSPEWCMSHIRLRNDSLIAIVDDDKNIYQFWKSKFENLNNAGVKIKVEYFKDLNEFAHWIESGKYRDSKNPLFLIDYRFQGDQETGCDFIEKKEISEYSVLVSNSYDDPELLLKCIDMKLKLIPKPMMDIIPVNIE